MADAYLAVQRISRGSCDLLLAQRNIYLPPHGKYQYASIARNAVQYVVPGGRIQPGEAPAAAAVRELFEDTGLQIPVASLQLFLKEEGHYYFFKVSNPADLDVQLINSALSDGRTGSLKTNNMTWVPLEEAPAKFGNKEEYQGLPWTAAQIVRALNAGFSKELIGMRANEHHMRHTRAVAKLILDTYACHDAPPESSSLISQQAGPAPATAPTATAAMNGGGGGTGG